MLKELDLKIENAPRGGAFVEIPIDIKAEYGKYRLPVKAFFDGYEYVGSIVKMHGKYILGVKKDIREAIKKSIGDTVHVKFEEDKSVRKVQIPKDLLIELEKTSDLLNKFQKLSYSHQKEYVNWINDAKKAETRERRILKTIEKIK